MDAPLKALVGRRYETAFLADGSVGVRGFDIDYVGTRRAPGKSFRQGLQGAFDIYEQAFSHYLVAKDQGCPLVAIPVFPSRFFTHFGIFVGIGSPIKEMDELAGKTICIPDFGYNPAVWARGVLLDQYGVLPESITWLVSKTRPILGDFEARVAAHYNVEFVGTGDAGDGLYGFQHMIESGKADAIVLPRAPASTGFVRPLLGAPYGEARRSAALLGGVPINTVLTLTLRAVRDHSDLPQALLEACEQASGLFRAGVMARRLDDRHQDMHLLQLERDKLFPWEFGVNVNRAIIDRMIGYCVDQGIIETRFAVDDLFVGLQTTRLGYS